MNKTIIGILGGATIGALTTFIIMRDKIKEVQANLDSVSKELDDVYDELQNVQDGINDLVDGKDKISEKASKEATEAHDEATAVVERARDKRHYSKLVDKYRKGGNLDTDGIDPSDIETEESEDTYKYEQMSERSNSKHNKYINPYVITLDEFNDEDYNNYDKNTLYFYEDDEVLTEENAEEVIADPIKYIGDAALESFGDGSGDPEVVYVRNDTYEIDYEVIRLSKSYQETVLGYENKL